MGSPRMIRRKEYVPSEDSGCYIAIVFTLLLIAVLKAALVAL